ncbi:MAG: dihydroorotate dehydrogenase-like protein [Spirochaetota bacterium]
MGSMKTTYMGIELKNPVIAGASRYTAHMDTIKKLEDSGVGAVVIASLFEEQIQLESLKLEEDLEQLKYRHPEMIEVFPDLKHAGPEEHLVWVKKAKESVNIPVIASLNAVNRDTWVEYASALEETGVDGLELNFFATPSDFKRSASDIEEEQIEIIREIRGKVRIPISVKLSTLYTNPLQFIKRIDDEGVDGFVLFNRFFEPDIDIRSESSVLNFNLSGENDHRLPLRFAGLLYGNIKADICSSTGIMQADEVIKMILAGATCIQCVTTLYKNDIKHLQTILEDLEKWMDEKGYKDIQSFRGKLSKKNTKDPWMYTRAQYVRLLTSPEPVKKIL